MVRKKQIWATTNHKLLLVELLHIILGIVLWPVYQGTYCIVGKSTVTALN